MWNARKWKVNIQHLSAAAFLVIIIIFPIKTQLHSKHTHRIPTDPSASNCPLAQHFIKNKSTTSSLVLWLITTYNSPFAPNAPFIMILLLLMSPHTLSAPKRRHLHTPLGRKVFHSRIKNRKGLKIENIIQKIICNNHKFPFRVSFLLPLRSSLHPLSTFFPAINSLHHTIPFFSSHFSSFLSIASVTHSPQCFSWK